MDDKACSSTVQTLDVNRLSEYEIMIGQVFLRAWMLLSRENGIHKKPPPWTMKILTCSKAVRCRLPRRNAFVYTDIWAEICMAKVTSVVLARPLLAAL